MINVEKTGILFVHGIQGRPEQFDFLQEGIPEDIVCINTFLPGHGATVSEFRNVGMKDWLISVQKQALELSRSCGKIYFVGHSMGCLLGLLTALSGEVAFSGMLLLCCPYAIRPTMRYFRNNLLALKTKGETDDPFVKSTWEANSVSVKHITDYLFCVRPYAGLLGLIRKTRRTEQKPACSVFALFSERDEIVSLKSARWAKRKCDAAVEVMKDCGHNYFTNAARKRMREELVRMLGVAMQP